MSYSQRAHAVRGCIVHCRHDPGEGDDPNAFEVFQDGLLIVDRGHIVAVGPAEALLSTLGADTPVEDQRGRLIVPGFIDTHIHYAQTDMIASYGEQLLTWLERYTFPTEQRFADRAVADETAAFFTEELLRNGTTSALVLGTVHPQSVDAIFEQARSRGMRLAAGKVLMDRNVPEDLRDTPDDGYRESLELIERWHGVDRLSYAITPRFAPSSSDAQLARAGELASRFPDTYIHSHLAENRDELAWVAELFPWSRSYLDVYDHFGLLRERSVYGHSIYLDEADRRRMAETGAVAVFCPTSNLFLGSGLFDYARMRGDGVTTSLATDVGAGTSFSMIQTVAEAYKVSQLTGTALSAPRLLYLATLAGAQALDIDDRVGRFDAGHEADFVVLDPKATPLMARRNGTAETVAEQLFALFILGDDRCVHSTWLQGVCQHRRYAVGAAG